MSYTTNLGLPLMPDTPAEGVTGLDLRKMINGENENSMAQILDKIIEPNTNKATATDNATIPDDDNKFPTCALVNKALSNIGNISLEKTVIFEEQEISGFSAEEGMALLEGILLPIVMGETYIVSWDEVDYKCVAVNIVTDGVSSLCLGNLGVVDNDSEDTGEPFVIITGSFDGINITSIVLENPTEDSHTIAIYKESTVNYLTTEDKKELVKLILDNELFSNGSMTFTHLSTIDRYTWHQIGSSAINFIPGETYYVEWDGKFYKCIASIGTMNGKTYHGIGNTALVGIGEDTGEPFGIVYNLEVPQNMFVSNDTEENTHSVKIYQKLADNSIEQVQSDWNETDTSSPAYIKNKPVITGGGASVQANWEQTDETQADFIKNKPFYEYERLTEILPLTTFSDFYLQPTIGMYMQQREATYSLTIGETYIVTWDNVDYECIAQDGAQTGGEGSILLGNESAPFAIVMTLDNYEVYFALTDTEAGGSHNVRIVQDCTIVKKLDPKFSPVPYFGEGDTVSTELIPTTDMKFEFDSSLYGSFGEASDEQMTLWNSDWTNTTVVWDGIKYTCEPQYQQGIKFIGNIDLLMGSGDNGMPFIFMIGDDTTGTLSCQIISLVDLAEEISTEYQYSAASFSLVDGKNYYVCDNEISIIAFVEGTTYKVSWNGSSYDNMATLYTSDDATYIGVGNPSILGLSDSNGAEYFIYTKTLSDGTRSSGVVTTSTNTGNTFGVVYAPDVTHNVGVIINQTDIVTIDSKYIGDVSWDKISDKPFGKIPSGTVVVDKTTVNCSIEFGSGAYAAIINEPDIVAGVSYEIECDGTTNICVAEATSNGGVSGVAVSGKDESCIIYKNYIEGISVIISTQGSHTFKITLAEDIIKTIEPEFIPEIDGLPEVTTNDNGKTLLVSDGVWSVAEPPKGVPEVTSEDAGKFLRVGSNGTWIVEAVEDAEEVAF